jgi:hypothetical protein
MVWYHPKYYAELRRLRKLQAASDKRLQPEVASTKLQATSHKHQATSDSKKDSKSTRDKQQAS